MFVRTAKPVLVTGDCAIARTTAHPGAPSGEKPDDNDPWG